MKKMLFLLAVLFMQQAFAMAQAGEKNFIDQHYIEVTGNATLEIVPDEIYMKIILDEKITKGKQSILQLETNLFDILKKLNIDTKKSLSIRDASSNYKLRQLKKPDVLAMKEYILCVNNAETVGRIFTELDQAGISNVSIDKIDHSQIEKLRQDVKINAIKAAKEKAIALTGAIGQKTGLALYVYEYPTNNERGKFTPRIQSNVAMDYASPGTSGASDVDFEKITLESSILVRFEMY